MALLVLDAPARAGDYRIALVIGNGNYADAPLRNPPNDARLMAETLEGLGFDVETRIDVDQTAMRDAVVAFGDRLSAAGREGVALFYYAGHGAQFQGRNFLIPVGARLERESHLLVRTVPVDEVMDILRHAGTRLKFVVLDACRNNPLAMTSESRAATRGLGGVTAPTGTLISYATQPNNVAADGGGENSPYTAALAAALAEPGLMAEQVFKRTAIAVARATDERQVPWIEGVLLGDFYFNPPVAGGATTSVSATASGGEPGADLVFWNDVKDSGDPDMLRAYLRAFPEGTFVGLARLRLAALQPTGAATSAPGGDRLVSRPAVDRPTEPAPERLVALPETTLRTRYEDLGYVVSLDDILTRPYAYLAYQETDLNTGDWAIRIRSNGITAGTVLAPDVIARAALRAAAAGEPYFVHGFSMTPQANDPRLVETRVHVVEGKPVSVSMHLVTRRYDNRAKAEVTARFPWPRQ